MNIMKCVQVNGIKINKKVEFRAKHNGYEYEFIFCPYEEYLQNKWKFINSDEIEKCNTVVIYSSMGNNSIEIYYIKIFISIIYFSRRICVEEHRKKEYFAKDPLIARLSEEKGNELYNIREGAITKNWNTRGYWNENEIEYLHWYVKLGKKRMECDDFESYLSRAYGNDLCDSFAARYQFRSLEEDIPVDDEFVNVSQRLNCMINEDTKYGNKLKSSMRLYYELFMIYANMNISIITISTILETLLLGADESNQRKKVAVRSACLLFDGMEKNVKISLADTIYFFYSYRNAIVHDGKNYLDFPEVQLNTVVENMKHVIYGIIYFYYINNPTNDSDIINCVIRNQSIDGITNAFDYISANANNVYPFSLTNG